jgi:hypothetical protein
MPEIFNISWYWCFDRLDKEVNVLVFALLGCDAAYVGVCLWAFRDSLSVPIFKGQAAQEKFLFDSVGPAMQELSRSNRRLEQIPYDRSVTAFNYPQTKRTALFQIYALYAYIRLSEPFCKALTVSVKYTCHESVKIQAHEFWIILPYGFILRQKLRQTRRGVSV